MSQKEKKKLVSIKTDDTLMETALHGTHLFPYKLYDDNITDYDFNCIDWHWHTEFEFVYIESGIVHFKEKIILTCPRDREYLLIPKLFIKCIPKMTL